MEFLLRQGWAGVFVLALGWGYRDERRERQALQERFEAVQRAHSEVHIATIRETTAALAAVERAVLNLGLKGGGNG